MPDSVYKIIELVGTSTASWEDAAKHAVETAAKSLDELRIAEVAKLDMKVEGKWWPTAPACTCRSSTRADITRRRYNCGQTTSHNSWYGKADVRSR